MEHRPGKVQAGLTPGRTAKSSAIDYGRGVELWLRRARAILVVIQRDLRDAEPGQIILCAALGCVVGAVTDLLREGVAWLHVYDFGISADHYLSEGIGVSRIRLLFVPLIGGLLLGLAARAVWARRFSEIVDPIEANALHGGRMSLRDSIWLALTTVISNAAGASVGMEAGYSQLGAGLYSWAGRWF
jgi:chloride channel protein, CIC family